MDNIQFQTWIEETLFVFATTYDLLQKKNVLNVTELIVMHCDHILNDLFIDLYEE